MLFHNIYVALSNRVFEGLASDNLLHFILNTVYAQSTDQNKISSLINYSLALYLIGISISPFVAGLFGSFTISFFMALGFFVIAAGYLQICVCYRGRLKNIKPTVDQRLGHPSTSNARARSTVDIKALFKKSSKTVISPLLFYKEHPLHLPIGLSLLSYNAVQSYIFNALLIHTSVHFGFTGKENGFIITIAHSVAALYIFFTIYIIPKLANKVWGRKPREGAWFNPTMRDGILALISLTLQLCSLLAIGLATRPWQIYTITALLALSLPTASFVKSYSVGNFIASDKVKILAALTMMEALGSVLSPIFLGGWQSYTSSSSGVFFGAAGIAGFSTTAFGLGFLVTLGNRSRDL